jgi:UV DNA damage endonuclease
MKSSLNHRGGLRPGLGCQFSDAPLKFCTATATALARLARRDQLIRLAEICRHHAESLLEALHFCATHGIGSFRIPSQILPLKTHPQAGCRIEEPTVEVEARAKELAGRKLQGALSAKAMSVP